VGDLGGASLELRREKKLCHNAKVHRLTKTA